MVFFHDVTFLVVFFVTSLFLRLFFHVCFVTSLILLLFPVFGSFFGIFLLFVHPKKHTKETVKTDLLTKFHVIGNNSNSTLLFNLKLEFFWL